MTVIVSTEGEDDRFIEGAAAVVFEHPNMARICRDGQEDEFLGLRGTSSAGGPRTRVSVVP